MNVSYVAANSLILAAEFIICGIYLICNYKDTIIHYHIQFWWTFVLQISSAVYLNSWLAVKHPYVYLNTSENDLEQGIITVAGMDLSRSAILQFGVLLPLSLHCFYAATRKVWATDKTKVQYDPSIKWIEYMISSSFQTLLLYSLYGQVGQTLWTAVGLKMFSMFSGYSFERILMKGSSHTKLNEDVRNILKKHMKNSDISEAGVSNKNFTSQRHQNDIMSILHKHKNDSVGDLISRTVLAAPRFIISISFVIYFLFHYFPLVIHNDERPLWVNFFIAGLIINDASFPGTLLYFRNNLGSVRADRWFSIWSMISKNTFDIFLVLGTKRISDWGIIALIPGSILVGYFINRVLQKIDPIDKDVTYYSHTPKSSSKIFANRVNTVTYKINKN